MKTEARVVRQLAFGLLVFLAVAAIPANAGVIWEETTSTVQGGPFGGIFPPLASSVTFGLSVGSGCAFGVPCYGIFDLTLTAADIGHSFTANALTNPDFANIAATLTNGINDQVGEFHHFSFDSTGSSSEQNYFFNGTGGPDFAGYNISALVLTINSLTITDDGPWNGGEWYYSTLGYTLDVEGGAPTPEPSCFFLIGGALAVLVTLRRRLAGSSR